MLGPGDGVHLIHSMGDTFALMRALENISPARAVIVGAAYLGLEMADALPIRGLSVNQTEQLPKSCVQLSGHRRAEIATRIDMAATVIFHAMTVGELSDLDLSCAPPLGSPGTPSRPVPRYGDQSVTPSRS